MSTTVSQEALDLYRASDVVDLHIDSFIWTRIVGYDLLTRHRFRPTGRHFCWHVDLPRAIDDGLTGGVWSITTNPFRTAARRRDALVKNLAHLTSILARAPGVALSRSAADYRSARAAGQHAAFLAVQGGNALASSIDDLDLIPDRDIVRVTLVHLASSRLGATSSPLSRLDPTEGLTDFGRDYVQKLNDKSILVDLAHISHQGFWDALAVHDHHQPVVVSHTGVSGVQPHWRNLSDEQVRAVALTGGCVGIMLQEQFLGRPCSVATVADHLDHLTNVGGEDTPAIGTDFDGMITPPADLAGYHHFPRLVQALLDRRWPVDRIRKVLGANALRVMEAVRG